MYKGYTRYIGFTTGQVINLWGGGQMVWIDNGDHWSVVEIHRGGTSTLIAEHSK